MGYQKEANQKRVEWPGKNAQDIARAAGEIDWTEKMKDMAQLARQLGVNCKMTTAIKGSGQGLNRIEVPLFEWYYSDNTKEIY